MHITLRGLRFVDVSIIYPILGKVVFQISFTHCGNILAYNIALVTRGNFGLPRLNSSRKSSDIPLPTQLPIWVNPMGPITLSFSKKCYNVTTPDDNLQISSTKRAFIECMFLPPGSGHCIRNISLIWWIKNHVNETRSQQNARAACTQWSARRCALFDVNKRP